MCPGTMTDEPDAAACVAYAPGKVVLSGAYAVLEGAPALVTAVDRYVVADAKRRAERVTPELLAALHMRGMPEQVAPWYDASSLRSGGPVDRKLGLGSSAAILVSCLGALELGRAAPLERGALRAAAALCERVFDTAWRAHRTAQGGGSGIDVAASAYGGTLRCQLERGALTVERAWLPKGLVVEVWTCPNDASTARLLAIVRDYAARRPLEYRRHIEALGNSSERAGSARTAEEFVEACRRQLAGLDGLGRDSGAPIVTAEVAAFGRAAEQQGGVVFPSGAGGGDIVLWVGTAPTPPNVREQARTLGLELLPLQLGARGVHAASEHVASGHAASGPVASGHAASGPVASGHAASGPVASGHAASGPVASGHAASGHAASEHVASGHIASGHIASGHAVSEQAGAGGGGAPEEPALDGALMETPNSRVPGFHKLSVGDRRQAISDRTAIGLEPLLAALDAGGLTPALADKIVENVVGTYALPFAIALNFQVNGRDYLVPMVIEEPSVVAAASSAAKMVRDGGGFHAEVDPPIMTCQVQVYDVADVYAGAERILAAKESLLEDANRAVPGLVRRGGGAQYLEVRSPAPDMLVTHVYVNCQDAMGANLVNSIAEALGDRIAALGEGKRGLRILSNLSDRRCARIDCTVPVELLATETQAGEQVALGIVNASRFAEVDPYRAATHNKGIMNGIDAVCMATGNDWRAIEAGAHAFAARLGRYQPLATWRREEDDGRAVLHGSLLLPMALGTVGGTLRVHPTAALALRVLDVRGASELAAVAGSVGLASNLAALRALATDGIQRGHMALHARSVAVAAGAIDDEVEAVATTMVAAKEITVDAARRLLSDLRREGAAPPSRAPSSSPHDQPRHGGEGRS